MQGAMHGGKWWDKEVMGMQKCTVLVVDNEAIVRESIRDWLEESGYTVATAGTGEEALEKIKKGDFNIVVMDVRLPGKTGLTILRELRDIKPKLRSILITAYP